MQKYLKRFKEKLFVAKLVSICLNCGSTKITHNQYTIFCNDCGALNFYEAV